MKKYLLPILLLLSCFSCIEQTELDIESIEPLIVVDGQLTDVMEQQTIRLRRSTGVNIQLPTFVSGAEVYVENQDGDRVLFLEMEEGTYCAFTRAEPNQQYRLYAILPDGILITSNLQTVPSPFPIDEIIAVDTMVNILTQDGRPLRINALDFYASGGKSIVTEEQYLRFNYETVYQMKEALCTPFISPDTCFVYNDLLPYGVNLLRINVSETPVSYLQFVNRRKIDGQVAELFSLDLYLYAYNKEEFEYWEKFKTLFDQSGTVTDPQPARLLGNITASDGSEILGQFAVVGKSRRTKFVSNTDFASIVQPVCGLPGNVPDPIPDVCCACLDIEGGTYRRPYYWP